MRQKKTMLIEIHTTLYDTYGPQGWWPIASLANKQGVDDHGYHKGNHDYPKTSDQQWEVVLGAILTQNTAWTNVEKALAHLRTNKTITKEQIVTCDTKKLARLIRPAGYFNQKANRLKIVAKFFIDNPLILEKKAEELQKELLTVKGIGPETADSIILYAAKKPMFVIDAYTKRIMSRMGLAEKNVSYDQLQRLFMNGLPPDEKMFNEYHALIVEHAKRYCRTKPLCEACPLAKRCKKLL